MSKFIREVGGELEATSNVNKLNDLVSTRKCLTNTENTDIDNLIAQTHIFEIELSHLIKTEDIIKNENDVSKELRDFSTNVAKEFMEKVLDPLAKNLVEFMEKHPEYIAKNLVIDSRLESGKSVAIREMKHLLMEAMK